MQVRHTGARPGSLYMGPVVGDGDRMPSDVAVSSSPLVSSDSLTPPGQGAKVLLRLPNAGTTDTDHFNNGPLRVF